MSEKYQCIKTTAKNLKEIYKNETMDKIFEDFAEALNDYQDFGCELCKAQDKLKDKIAETEAKLANSKKQCRECKHLNKKIELNIKNKLVNEIDQLKRQITEEKNRNKKLNHEAQKYYEDAYCNGFQNKKAIEQLGKVKEWLEPKYFDKEQINYLAKAIDQQIAELKGEK